MSQTFTRKECERCGTSLRHVGKAPAHTSGHHPTAFECPNEDCPREEVHRG